MNTWFKENVEKEKKAYDEAVAESYRRAAQYERQQEDLKSRLDEFARIRLEGLEGITWKTERSPGRVNCSVHHNDKRIMSFEASIDYYEDRYDDALTTTRQYDKIEMWGEHGETLGLASDKPIMNILKRYVKV